MDPRHPGIVQKMFYQSYISANSLQIKHVVAILIQREGCFLNNSWNTKIITKMQKNKLKQNNRKTFTHMLMLTSSTRILWPLASLSLA